MHKSLFFKLFPPPKYMTMKHAGLHISDDAIYFLEYGSDSRGTIISKYGHIDLPQGVVDGGNIVNEKTFKEILTDFDHKNDLTYVKVSIPEEKTYLFQTEVPDGDIRSIAQNIEFKLEENVPLSIADAVFYFDLLPQPVSPGTLRASVSVVPRVHLEHYIAIMRDSGVFPVAFEVLPKAAARAVVPKNAKGSQMLVYIMPNKTGIYVVSDGVVSFTSTVGWGSKSSLQANSEISSLVKEINRIYTYMLSRNDNIGSIDGIILLGHEAAQFESVLRSAVPDPKIKVGVADVWQNVIDFDKYVPTISKDESLNYAVAAGLAIFN